jgi:Flp pilus assembly pilin Flp
MRLSTLKRIFKRPRPRRFLKNDRGVAAIEFAFLGPLFGVAFLVTMQTGLLLYTEYVIQTSVQEVARLVRTGRVHTPQIDPSGVKAEGIPWDAAKLKEALCFIAGRVSHCEQRMTVYMQTAATFRQLKANVPNYLSIGSDAYAPDADGSPTTPFDCGGPQEAVALIATYDSDPLLPIFMTNFANMPDGQTRRIIGFTMFRNEPYPAPENNATACQST